MAEIGEPQEPRRIEIVPRTEPVPRREAAPAPERAPVEVPEYEPEKTPA
jgi:hypothetical protein